MITVNGLSKRYGSKEVLRGINCQVDRGEVFALIGPSGAGKTTLLRLLDLLDRPSSGTIYFDGLDTGTSEKARQGIRRRIAIVFQKPILFSGSVADDVAYGLKVRAVKGEALQSRLGHALEVVGLSGYEGRKARTLSGGEVQRVALARAVALEPELLLLDEPTANLDPVSAVKIEKLIAGIIQELKTTVIMATHDLSQGQRLARRIGVLMDGELVQTGDPAQIFGLPRSREVAEFVGVENVWDGVIATSDGGLVNIDVGGHVVEAVSDLGAGEAVSACIRPEDVLLALEKTTTSARNVYMGQLVTMVSAGPLVRVELDCGFPLVALVTRRSAEEMALQPGQQVYASFKATGVHVIHRGIRLL